MSLLELYPLEKKPTPDSDVTDQNYRPTAGNIHRYLSVVMEMQVIFLKVFVIFLVSQTKSMMPHTPRNYSSGLALEFLQTGASQQTHLTELMVNICNLQNSHLKSHLIHTMEGKLQST